MPLVSRSLPKKGRGNVNPNGEAAILRRSCSVGAMPREPASCTSEGLNVAVVLRQSHVKALHRTDTVQG
jgi:hypothetical protein